MGGEAAGPRAEIELTSAARKRAFGASGAFGGGLPASCRRVERRRAEARPPPSRRRAPSRGRGRSASDRASGERGAGPRSQGTIDRRAQAR